ncbi:MAG: hypothetical protein ACLGXA_08050 [Acidobacteriota bacterium]
MKTVLEAHVENTSRMSDKEFADALAAMLRAELEAHGVVAIEPSSEVSPLAFKFYAAADLRLTDGFLCRSSMQQLLDRSRPEIEKLAAMMANDSRAFSFIKAQLPQSLAWRAHGESGNVRIRLLRAYDIVNDEVFTRVDCLVLPEEIRS